MHNIFHVQWVNFVNLLLPFLCVETVQYLRHTRHTNAVPRIGFTMPVVDLNLWQKKMRYMRYKFYKLGQNRLLKLLARARWDTKRTTRHHYLHITHAHTPNVHTRCLQVSCMHMQCLQYVLWKWLTSDSTLISCTISFESKVLLFQQCEFILIK